MFTYMLTFVVGAVANRLRGGGVVFQGNDYFGTQKRRLTYCAAAALVFIIARADLQNATWDGIAYYNIGGETLARGAAVFAILFAAHLTGWGRAVGAAGGWENKELEEFKPLDWLTTKTLQKLGKMPSKKRRGQVFTYSPKKYLRLWGFSWLTYWGLAVGGMLAVAAGNLVPLLAFGAMGAVYCGLFYAYQKTGKDVGKGWPAAEWVFGAISFAGLL